MTRRLLVFLALLGSLAAVLALTLASGHAEAAADERALGLPQTLEVSSYDHSQTLSGLPLRFVANAGQVDPDVRFTVRRAGHTIFLTPDGLVFSAVEEVEGEEAPVHAVVRLHFAGANLNPTVEGLDPLPGTANYFLGNDPDKWRVGVPTYEAIVYRDLYPSVDLVYRGTQGHLKSEFWLAPGADPAAIEMVYEGTEALYLRENGALVLQTPLGELIEEPPFIYQEGDNARQVVPGGYVLRGDKRVGFRVAEYDPTQPLVIDPALAYASYLGGSGFDFGAGIDVDGAGNIYITGWTPSSDFPTADSMQPYGGEGSWGYGDVFVTQLISTSGVYTYGYSTYLGGSGDDRGLAIAVDDMGRAIVTGQTFSNDFPTHKAVQTYPGGSGSSAFATQIISTSGSYTLAYSTYLGGSGNDFGIAIAVDGMGNAYVAGGTYSTDFPTVKAVQASHAGGGADAFVTQIISVSGVYAYGYSTYLGGSGDDRAFGIAMDGVGNANVIGITDSSDFPTTTNAIQTDYGGGTLDAFVAQIISANGAYTLGHSTYLGGSGFDFGAGIAVDGAGAIYAVGQTYSSDLSTHNALDLALDGYSDAFVTQIISASGVYTYGYATYLGGSSNDCAGSIDADSAGNVYVVGHTYSSDFPTRNAMDMTLGGDADIFVVQVISASGVYTLGYATYLGGSGTDLDDANSAIVDSAGNVYATGQTDSSDFPVTASATQVVFGGAGGDAFVAKIIGHTGLMLYKDVTPDPVVAGQAITYILSYANEGVATVSGVLITDVVPVTVTDVSVSSSGPRITPTGSVSFTWEVGDLAPGEGGVILITGIVSPSIRDASTLTNRATIATTDGLYIDPYPANNESVVHTPVWCRVFLPLVLRQ
jgi:uncharacterized repeat protein (TIGR01451 family)